MRWNEIKEAKIPFGKLGNTQGMTFGFESEIVISAGCFYSEVDLYDFSKEDMCLYFDINEDDFDRAFTEWKESEEKPDADIQDWIEDVGEGTWWHEMRCSSFYYGVIDYQIVRLADWGNSVENLAEDMVEEFSIETPITARDDMTPFEKKNYKHWYIEGDASVGGRTESDHGVEVVSPVFHSYEEFQNMLSHWLEWFPRHYSGEIYTNKSTGLHINIGIPDARNRIDFLKLLLFSGEKWAAETWRGDHREHTGEMLPMVIKPNPDNEKTQPLIPDITKANETAITIIKKMQDKAFAINLLTLFSRGYVEFKPIGGTGYEKDIKRVFDHISRFVQLIQIASDPELYRDEYMYKLGKRMLDDSPDRSSFTRPNGQGMTKLIPVDVKIVENWLSTLRLLSKRDRDNIVQDNKIVITPEKLMSYVGYFSTNGNPIPDLALKAMIRASGLDKKYLELCRKYDVHLPWSMDENIYYRARKRLDPMLG